MISSIDARVMWVLVNRRVRIHHEETAISALQDWPMPWRNADYRTSNCEADISSSSLTICAVCRNLQKHPVCYLWTCVLISLSRSKITCTVFWEFQDACHLVKPKTWVCGQSICGAGGAPHSWHLLQALMFQDDYPSTYLPCHLKVVHQSQRNIQCTTGIHIGM